MLQEFLESNWSILDTKFVVVKKFLEYHMSGLLKIVFFREKPVMLVWYMELVKRLEKRHVEPVN